MADDESFDRIRQACLPVAKRLAEEWKLELGEELPGASAALVLGARTADGAEVVLKIPKPNDDEVESWRGVQAFANYGGVGLIKVHEETGTMLMPRLTPGTKLGESELSDMESVDVCASLILRLRESRPASTTPLSNWFQQLDDAPDLPHVKDARRIARELLETTDRVVNLHGDFHQYNIILGADGWTAIDPKFLIGDPSHEVVGFMRNDMAKAMNADGMRARLERFSERLGDPIERLWGWSFAQTVLCCAWSSGPSGESFWTESVEAIWEARP